MAAPELVQAAESELVELLLPQVTRFLASEVHGYAIDRDGEIPASVREGAARLGLFGMTIPASHGGAGLSLGSAGRVVAEIARVDRSVAIMIGLHAGLGTRGLVEYGSAALRARWLPRLASGECIASFAATEAGAGSDLMAIRTTGKVTDRGLRIDGEKSYVTNGGFASLFTLLVRTPGLGGARAHSLVCVPAGTPGVQIGREEDKLGIRGSSTVTVSFDGAVVPLDHVLGAAGKGLQHAYELLTWGRTLMSAGCVGTARAALDATVAHVATRRQFGRAVGDFGATRAHVAWMAARVRAMESLVASVSAAHAAGESIETASAIAKVFCSDSAFEVCDRALQLHGALGFLEETGVARMLRDCRITRIFEGANDVLLVRVGAAMLAGQAAREVTCEPELCEVAERVEGVERTLRHEAGALAERLGVEAIRHQVALQRIARAQIAVRAAAAVLERASGVDVPLARYAAEQLIEEARSWLDRLWWADRDEAAARDMTDRMAAS
jgi:alkylation response protein AidB-like acyl-CoA dehydrogenase